MTSLYPLSLEMQASQAKVCMFLGITGLVPGIWNPFFSPCFDQNRIIFILLDLFQWAPLCQGPPATRYMGGGWHKAFTHTHTHTNHICSFSRQLRWAAEPKADQSSQYWMINYEDSYLLRH